MIFEFEVGEREKHLIEYYFEELQGEQRIKVDNKVVYEKGSQLLSFWLKRYYDFVVGESERHMIRIEKTRKLLFAGFRKSKYKVFVDGEFTKEYVG